VCVCVCVCVQKGRTGCDKIMFCTYMYMMQILYKVD